MRSPLGNNTWNNLGKLQHAISERFVQLVFVAGESFRQINVRETYCYFYRKSLALVGECLRNSFH